MKRSHPPQEGSGTPTEETTGGWVGPLLMAAAPFLLFAAFVLADRFLR